MPQQITTPAASSPLVNLPTPEPLAPTLLTSPALAPPPPEEVKQVTLEPDAATTSSIVPVETNPEAENLGEAPTKASAPPAPPVSEKPEPKLEPRPDVARADPKEETSVQVSPAEDSTEAETPPSPPVAEPVAPKKPTPQATPKVKAPAKAETKADPAAAKKRAAATAKRTAQQTRRVVRRPQTPVNQGIMSFFGGGLKPQAGTAANTTAKRPVVRQ
jgi:hypothetical protein